MGPFWQGTVRKLLEGGWTENQAERSITKMFWYSPENKWKSYMNNKHKKIVKYTPGLQFLRAA